MSRKIKNFYWLVVISFLVIGSTHCRNATDPTLTQDEGENTDGTGGDGTDTIDNIPPLYLYSAGSYEGDMGGRAGVDDKCKQALPFGLEEYEAAGFVSISLSDEIRDMPDKYGFDVNRPVLGAKGKNVPTGIPNPNLPFSLTGNEPTVGDNWEDLLDGDIKMTLIEADIMDTNEFFWSGSDSDGSLNGSFELTSLPFGGSVTYFKGNNCGGFDSPDLGGAVGKPYTFAWLEAPVSINCEIANILLCIAF